MPIPTVARRALWQSPRLPWLLSCVLALVIGYQQLSLHVVDPVGGIALLGLLREFDSAVEARDGERLAALFAADAEHFVLTTGRLVRGRDALRRMLEAEFGGEAGSDEVDTEIAAFRFVTPDVLLADLTATYANYRLGDRVWPEFREHTMVILVRRRGSWRIAATSAGGHDASR